jgi:hypothetical protein
VDRIIIDRPIVDYRVESAAEATVEVEDQSEAPALSEAPAPSEAAALSEAPAPSEAAGEAPARDVSDDGKVVRMHEKLERPEMLLGSTYKVKTPISDHAMYVTINDIILNVDTKFETRRPFEIFINSKNLDHYQWIVALTRIMSAVFRKGGDVTFLVDELKAVFDPRGGYWQPGGTFMPSIIAELGHIVEKHLRYIGMLPAQALDEHQQKLVDKKRREFEEQARQKDAFATTASYPAGAQLCGKCSTTAVVMLDGCMTCLNCGESKCG